RGVDEGDQTVLVAEVREHLVGADVLGDAACLALADVGLADRVEQAGLAVVDVTHDGDHRRADLQVVLAALVLAVGEVEALQQLAVLVLRADDLDDIVHLAAEQLEGLVVDRLGRGDHLAEVEQRLHESSRVRVDLLREVRQRRAASEADDLAVAARQPHAADRRSLRRVVFLALLPLGLAATRRSATGTAERARGTAATTRTARATAAATGTTTETTGSRGTGTGAGSAATATAVTAAAT